MNDSSMPLSLADARLVTRLRRGEPGALDELWLEWRDAVWSVCTGMSEGRRDLAIRLLRQAYEELPRAVRGWTSHQSICCQLSALIFDVICRVLELSDSDGISPVVPGVADVPLRQAVAQRLAAVPPFARLVYLIDLFFVCPAGHIAELVGVPESSIRRARSAAAWSLLTARKT